jgi:hypothetical protein
MDSAEVVRAALVAGVLGALLLVLAVRVKRDSTRDTRLIPPNPLADSPAVSATLAALGPQLAPGGAAGWLVVTLGTERAAVEALVGSLAPGLPEQGDFSVNRLVANAPVRLTGQVDDGIAVVTAVERLDVPA